MDKQYKARQPVGRFRTGDIVGGLTAAQIQDLLQRGVIEEVKGTSETKSAATTKTAKEVKADGE
jgi:chromosome segregation and condensation protein ScpB